MRTVRFDLKLRGRGRIPDSEMRLNARAFIKKQGDVPLEVVIKRVYVGLDHSESRPIKVVTYCFEGKVE